MIPNGFRIDSRFYAFIRGYLSLLAQ